MTNATVSYDMSVCPANNPATTSAGVVINGTATTSGNGGPAPFESQGVSTLQRHWRQLGCRRGDAARAMLTGGMELPRAEEYLRKYIAATSEPEPGAPLVTGAHWSLALVHEKQGRPQDARAELETALRLKSDFEPARLELKRLVASR